MLTRVDVQSETPFYLNVRDASPTDSIIVDSITGLDPPDLDLFLGEYARDGGFYSGRRVGPRNVVFNLVLNPNFSLGETVSGLRSMLYRAFIDPYLDDDMLQILLHDDSQPVRYVSGLAEKIETPIFAKETDVQISMMCPNPYILDYNAKSILNGSKSVEFVYTGTAETGFEIRMSLTSATNVLNLTMNGESTFKLNYPFLAGDTVVANSVRGQRKIYLQRGSTTSSIYYAQDPKSKWLDIHAPTNLLEVYGALDTDGNPIDVADISEINFRPTYWGV